MHNTTPHTAHTPHPWDKGTPQCAYTDMYTRAMWLLALADASGDAELALRTYHTYADDDNGTPRTNTHDALMRFMEDASDAL